MAAVGVGPVEDELEAAAGAVVDTLSDCTDEDDRLKDEDAGRADARTEGLLGELVASPTAPSSEGDRLA